MGYSEDILAHYGSQEIDFGELGAFIVNKYGDGEGKICAEKFEQIMINLLTDDGYTMAKFITGNDKARQKLKWRYVTNLKDGMISEV
tara:strand:- start:1070 stop:1330 length:261 start_codon:yes stop_codon:yes gene_type:complete